MKINDRLFGSPISGSLRTELEARQNLKFNKDTNALEPVNDESRYRLDTRTPFVRMWTSMKFIIPELLAQELQTYDVDGENPGLVYSRMVQDKKVLDLKKNVSHQITEIKNKGGEVIQYVLTDPTTRDSVGFSSTTYVIGDHNYQEKYGVSSPNQSRYKKEPNSPSDFEKIAEEVLKRPLEENPLMKPDAGITSVTSETEELLGVIKKTTINFVVHNFY